MPAKISGKLSAPPSKSQMQRVAIAAALAKGKTTIHNPSFSDDCLAALDAAKVLGAEVKIEKNKVVIEGRKHQIGNEINCRESGLCMRMLIPIAATFGKEITITGHGSLLSRPIDMVEKPLTQLGVKVQTTNGKLPVKIKGPIKGGVVEVDGSVSSQFVTGLTMALPLAKEDSQLIVKNLKSPMYVSLTESVLFVFGVNIVGGSQEDLIKGDQEYEAVENYSIEGDWSGASFLLVAAAIAGEVEVDGLYNGLQPDLGILYALEWAGAKVEQKKESVHVQKGELKAFKFNATNCPDLFPPLVVLAANCEGVSTIEGVSRLKHKESDRGAVLQKEFAKLGIKIEIDGDTMQVYGGKIKGGRIDSHNDHRIAMASAIAALNSENGIEIEGEDCVKKSYPNFFEDLEKLRVKGEQK